VGGPTAIKRRGTIVANQAVIGAAIDAGTYSSAELTSDVGKKVALQPTHSQPPGAGGIGFR